ncbi:MAG TPA: hypothetical protein VFK78_10380 [Gemmatimonadales bacterium]|nr:hypothetical protein [Gemmatimonadales bacterium]
MSDFFALEAGEYLERLDAVLQPQGGAAPALDDFVRLSRALRGSALMASQQAIARAASGLEALARALKDGRRPWDQGTQQLALRAVDDLKIFVRRASSWTDADTAKAEALGAQLEQTTGRPSGALRAAEATGLDAGARAFVAREGAAIASTLDRTAKALRANPIAHDPLQQVLRALQPLRGLAALNDLPPLPDLLEGVERLIGEIAHLKGAPPAGVPDLFDAAAAGVAQAAREVAERGRPDPEGAEFRRFAQLVISVFQTDGDVVPIAALYYSDTGPHIVQQGTAAARPATLGRLELVSHGEHLRQAADSLERAPSPTQRELRAHALAGTFRALADVGGGALAEQVATFAAAARDAVTSGVAAREPKAFAAELRRAGDLLARSSTEDENGLASQLAGITQAVRAIARPAATAAAAAAPVVPIESLAPAPSPVASPPVASESADLSGSWATYDRLVAAGIGPASLDELLTRATAVPPPAPSLDTARPAAPAVPSAPGATHPASPVAAELPIVDVRTLLYRGQRAQERAQELRAEARTASGERLRALVDEVCDLVGLALEPGP